MKIRVEIQMLPPAELNPNARVHWSGKSAAVREFRKAAWAEGYNVNPEHDIIFTRAVVSVTLVLPDYGRQEADPDNLIAMLKPALDGCVDAKILADDKRKNIRYHMPMVYEVDPLRAPLTIMEFEEDKTCRS